MVEPIFGGSFVRYVLLAAMLLTGCGPGEFFSAEKIAERRAAHQQAEAAEAARQAAFNATPVGQALLGCQFRTNAAMQAWRPRNIVDLEGVARSNQLMEQCMTYWRATNRLP
jgi:hypothetical protein